MVGEGHNSPRFGLLIKDGKRLAAVTALVALLLIHGHAPVSSQTSLMKLRVINWPGLLVQQNLFVAQERGIFRKNGLDVTFVTVPNGPASIAALVGGSVDLSGTDVNLPLLSNLQGADLQIVCGESDLYLAIIAGPKLQVPRLAEGYPSVMRDFVGKKLGVSALGSSQHFIWQALFEGAGLSPDSGTYVGVGLAPAALVNLLSQGQIDALIALDPILSLVTLGELKGKIVVDLRKHQGPPGIARLTPQAVYFGKRSFIERNSAAVEAFGKSLQEAAQWQRRPGNLPFLLRLMRDKVSMGSPDLDNSDAFSAMLKQNIPASTTTKISESGMEAWIQFVQKFSGYPTDVDVKRVVRDTVWSRACDK